MRIEYLWFNRIFTVANALTIIDGVIRVVGRDIFFHTIR